MFSELLEKGHKAECVQVPGNHPSYITYTSGTTGNPKGIVRDTAGYMVALNWSVKHVFGLDPGKKYFYFRNKC